MSSMNYEVPTAPRITPDIRRALSTELSAYRAFVYRGQLAHVALTQCFPPSRDPSHIFGRSYFPYKFDEDTELREGYGNRGRAIASFISKLTDTNYFTVCDLCSVMTNRNAIRHMMTTYERAERRLHQSVWARGEVAKAVAQEIKDSLPETFEVWSSHGLLIVDADTGDVLECDEHDHEESKGALSDITRFNVDEFKAWLADNDLGPCLDTDILLIGFWSRLGSVGRYHAHAQEPDARETYLAEINS